MLNVKEHILAGPAEECAEVKSLKSRRKLKPENIIFWLGFLLVAVVMIGQQVQISNLKKHQIWQDASQAAMLRVQRVLLNEAIEFEKKQ